MRTLRILAAPSLVLVVLLGAPGPTSAAESYDSCTGFIDSVPATITTQGTFCLRHNQSISASGIHAIEIQNSNVTIDCNGFKLGNGPAGIDTTSVGIFAEGGFLNIAVRRCTIQGFHDGINIDAMIAGSGHLIEDNLVSQNRVNGIIVMGAGTIVQRNTVVNTGGNSTSVTSFGIQTSGDVINNVVDGFSAASGVAQFQSFGIQTAGNGSLVQGNRIRNLVQKGMFTATGIFISGGVTLAAIRDNYLIQATSTSGTAINCDGQARVRDNVMAIRRAWWPAPMTAAMSGLNGHEDKASNEAAILS